MSNRRDSRRDGRTAGKTAESNARTAGAVHNRFTNDGELIYRPTAYPFEVVESAGYVVQTRLFTEECGCVGAYFLANDGDETQLPDRAKVFDDAKSAAKAAAKVQDYPELQEDGNFYPRVLKVRMSMIVEGVVFESVIRDIEGGAKVEGVA